MHPTKLCGIIISFFLFYCQVTFADSWTNRITVTVVGHGPDIVLIPGLTCSVSVWDPTAAHLQNHYRLHLIQVNGFAGTPPRANAEGPVVQPTMDAIHAYIKANKLGSVKVIGHSLGGTMGLMLAIQDPKDVRGLLIVDALPFSGLLLGAYDAALAQKMAARLRDRTLKESQEEYARGEARFIRILVKNSEGRKWVTAWATESDKSVVARATYDDMTTDLRPHLQNIKIPVTVLYPWDPDSGYSQEQTDSFYQGNYETLPNKKLVRIDHSFHFIMLDQPAEFLAQVDKFVGLP